MMHGIAEEKNDKIHGFDGACHMKFDILLEKHTNKVKMACEDVINERICSAYSVWVNSLEP